MEAFKYGIGQPDRSLANTVLTKENRPMLRNAMTRIPDRVMKKVFLDEYFKQKNPEEYAKIYVNAWPKVRLSRRLPRQLPPMKQTLATITERKRQRKQKTRKNRR
jgi:hypothetical protein